jgi:hypothetical protein
MTHCNVRIGAGVVLFLIFMIPLELLAADLKKVVAVSRFENRTNIAGQYDTSAQGWRISSPTRS